MPLPLNGKSILQTPEPHLIPGYAGHVPQEAFISGRRFSPLTHDLLTNPQVMKSGNSVLAHISRDKMSIADEMHEKRRLLISRRIASWGDQKFTYPLVPGYTGRVPRLENYCGKTFAECSFNAISEFENSQRIKREQKDELRAMRSLQAGHLVPADLQNKELPRLMTKAKMPLQRIRHDMLSYSSENVCKPQTTSVYKLTNDDRNKRFIAGYGGYVARKHELYGKDYENITHTALNMFTDDLKKTKHVLSTPVQINRSDGPPMENPAVYPPDSGMVARYTGHIPGGKYSFGRTYWQSTINAKDKLADNKMNWTAQQRAVITQ